MKLVIWGKSVGPTAERLWSGNVSWVPREGDWINLHSDWCALEVVESIYDVPTDSAELTIRLTDEDLAALKRDLEAIPS